VDVDIVAGGDPVPEDAGQLVGNWGRQGVDGLVVGVGRLERRESLVLRFMLLFKICFWTRESAVSFRGRDETVSA
jgi:hypothetical protein